MNKQPTFGPFDPTGVDPRAPVAPTPIQPIKVPGPKESFSADNGIGQPYLTSANMPNSQPSPAIKPGR